MMSTPLMIGCDLTKIPAETLAVLKNEELIALDQDVEARPPFYEEKQRYASKGRWGLLRLLANGEMVLAYYNFADYDLDVLLYFDDYGIPAGQGIELTDLLTGENIGVKYDCYNPRLGPKGFKIYKAKFVK